MSELIGLRGLDPELIVGLGFSWDNVDNNNIIIALDPDVGISTSIDVNGTLTVVIDWTILDKDIGLSYVSRIEQSDGIDDVGYLENAFLSVRRNMGSVSELALDCFTGRGIPADACVAPPYERLFLNVTRYVIDSKETDNVQTATFTIK